MRPAAGPTATGPPLAARDFGAVAARHQRQLWAVAVRLLHHPEDAADAVQEALTTAYRRVDSFRGDAEISTWLTRILINTCVDQLRRDRSRSERQLDEGRVARPDPAGGDLAGRLATRLSVQQALAQLPIGQRVAVVLVDAQGWSIAEVAELLEVPVGTIKSRCARGRARLAVLLGHLREEPR